ncbi:MAG TPA: GNAT family protein [Candidatus Limnocylindrales bacterium]|nr:GNAT family protein [Candidatus Limnocylindrales bacterium]
MDRSSSPFLPMRPGVRSSGAAGRPYPLELAGAWQARDGTSLTIRPIHPDDEPLLVRFHEQLSAETVYGRYFGYLKFGQRAAHRRLEGVCHIDYDRIMVLVAERVDPDHGEHEIVGIGRLMKTQVPGEAEFAVVVADAWQRHGIGTELIRRLIDFGRRERLSRIWGEILGGNAGMLRVCQRLGFRLRHDAPGASVRAELDL